MIGLLRGILRVIAAPIKIAAWALILFAFLLTAEDGSDTISRWMDREGFKP